MQPPQEYANVWDVEASSPARDAAHVGGVGELVEGGVNVLERFPAPEIRRVEVGEAHVVHVLRGGEHPEELDGVGGPAGYVSGQPLQNGHRAFAPAVRYGIRHLRAAARRTVQLVQPAHAHKVADVGHHPLRARLDEQVIVELREVLLDHGRFPGYDREQRPEGEVPAEAVSTALRVSYAVDRGQEIVELPVPEAHPVASRLNSSGSSLSSSAGSTLPSSSPPRGTPASRKGCDLSLSPSFVIR